MADWPTEWALIIRHTHKSSRKSKNLWQDDAHPFPPNQMRTHTHTYTPKRWVLKLLNILGKTLVAQMTDGMKNLWPKAQKAEERHAHTSTTPPKSRAAEPWEWGWGGGGGTPQHCDQYQAREGWEGWTLWGQRHKVTRGSAKRNMVPYTARCSTREDRWLSWTGSEWLAWQGQLTEEGVTWIMWWFDKRP